VELTFLATGLGTISLFLSPPTGLTEIILGDAQGDPLPLTALLNGSITVVSGSTTIPELLNPSVILGLGVMIYFSRTKIG
jgi:hypothetical protein